MKGLLTSIILISSIAIPQTEKHRILSSPARIMHKLPAPPSLLDGKDTITLTFLGDVMMHKAQIQNARNAQNGAYSFDSYFSELKGIIGKADLTVANMEFTLGGEPYSGYPCFSAPDSYADYIRTSGIDIFLTANNHILDKGTAGLERTLSKYSDKGILHTGTALSEAEDSLRNPLIVVVRGTRIAFINATYGTNIPLKDTSLRVHQLDSADIAEVMNTAKKKDVDFIIALPHWGIEYSMKHSARQRRWAEFFVRHGADAIIGAHPHVVQDVQMIGDVPVVYSLGNAISNMSAADTQTGLIVTLRIAVSERKECTLLEPEYTFTWCARPKAISNSYKNIPVKDWIDKKELWMNKYDYNKMSASYKRVKTITGISDIH